MNANPSSRTSDHGRKAMLRSALIVMLGAALYAAASSQLRTAPDDAIHFVTVPAAATAEPGSGMPAPSSTATEGNVVDLTYPQS